MGRALHIKCQSRKSSLDLSTGKSDGDVFFSSEGPSSQTTLAYVKLRKAKKKKSIPEEPEQQASGLKRDPASDV